MLSSPAAVSLEIELHRENIIWFNVIIIIIIIIINYYFSFIMKINVNWIPEPHVTPVGGGNVPQCCRTAIKYEEEEEKNRKLKWRNTRLC